MAGEPEPQLLVVDTNSYLRLFHSPVRPLLGAVIGGKRLVVTRDLVDEFYGSARLQEIYGWANNDPYRTELQGAILRLDAGMAAVIARDAPLYQQGGNASLDAYCRHHGLNSVRTLSRTDAKLLTTVIELGAVLVTDEWPLTHVATSLEADDDGNVLQTLSSMDVIRHCETCGHMTRDQRVETVRSWVLNSDLPFNFQATYRNVFGEDAPAAN